MFRNVMFSLFSENVNKLCINLNVESLYRSIILNILINKLTYCRGQYV